jgi:DNA-binding MarR family transcriptional regulator
MANSKYFGTFIERNYKTTKQTFLKAFKDAGIDITTEQWVILDLLVQKDGVSQTDLGTASLKDAPTTSRIIDLMCKKGFAERRNVENDRRKYHIYLTATGRTIHEQLLPIVLNLREIGWEGLDDKDYLDFLRIMNQIYANFSKLENK